MAKAETITWRELTGNKYSKGLHPAMLSDVGYIGQSRIRRIGDTTPTLFNVIYDRQYVIANIGNSLCKPLSNLSKETVLEVVSDAWDSLYPQSINEVVNKTKAS